MTRVVMAGAPALTKRELRRLFRMGHSPARIKSLGDMFPAIPKPSRKSLRPEIVAMDNRSPSVFCGAIAVLTLVGVVSVSQAGAAEDIRVRGKVVSADESTLKVETREGPTATVALMPGWKITGVAAASVDDIKPGDFVGVASLPKAAGGDGAVEVLIFPPALKGTGEGSYPWDVKPKSTMTNATVSNSVKGVDGRTLSLSYKGGEKKISIPEGTPIVTLAPATPTDLKPGAVVFVPAKRGDDGALATGFVVVGANGVVPPM